MPAKWKCVKCGAEGKANSLSHMAEAEADHLLATGCLGELAWNGRSPTEPNESTAKLEKIGRRIYEEYARAMQKEARGTP